MTLVSETKTTPPASFETELHQKIYDIFSELGIEFTRVDNSPAVTMDDCIEINRRLDVKTVKTLFLCNRQKTNFYLFITEADKPFVTKDFSRALGISRVSFAPLELLWDMLQTKVGATTVLSTAIDTENKVKVIFDNEVLKSEFYGCTDSTTTSYIKIKTDDLLNKFLPFTCHNYKVVNI